MAIGYAKDGRESLNIRYAPENRKELYYMWETQIRDSIASGSTKKQLETLIHVIRQITPELKDYKTNTWADLEPTMKEVEDEFFKHYPLLVPEFKFMMLKPLGNYRDEIYLRRLQKELNTLFGELTKNVEWLFLKKHSTSEIC